MSRDTEFHGAHANNYNKRPSFWRTKSLVDSTHLQLKSGQRLLDVGCGTGTDLGKLLTRYGKGVELYGVEPSQDILKQVPQIVAESLKVHFSNATADNISYGRELSPQVGGKSFVIDTSRNGNGPSPDFAWCNPSGRALGELPAINPGDPLIDAYLWVKVPGESEGVINNQSTGVKTAP